MRTVGKKREWLVAWAGADPDGAPWEDSWEPTRHLSPDLIHDFLADRKEKISRTISVDSRPLDTLVQKSIATAIVSHPEAGGRSNYSSW